MLFGSEILEAVTTMAGGGGAPGGTEWKGKVMAVGPADTEAALRIYNEDGR